MTPGACTIKHYGFSNTQTDRHTDRHTHTQPGTKTLQNRGSIQKRFIIILLTFFASLSRCTVAYGLKSFIAPKIEELKIT